MSCGIIGVRGASGWKNGDYIIMVIVINVVWAVDDSIMEIINLPDSGVCLNDFMVGAMF